MSARAAMDWTPLDQACDPIPGDPADVRITGIIFSKTADSVESAAGHLRRLESGEGQCSEAISKIQQRAGEAAGELDKVKTRYAGAASALMEYAEVLARSQDASLQALQAAGPASSQRRQANVQLSTIEMRAKSSQDPQERQELVDQLMIVKSRRDGALSDLNTAKTRLAQAIKERDEAANRAKSDIDQAVSSSALNDNGWDRVKKVLQDIVPTVLDIISVGCTVIACILLATGIGAPVAGVLLIVARITGGIAGLLKAWKKLDAGDTAGAWFEIGFAALSFFSAAKLLRAARLGGTAGLGKYVTKDYATKGWEVQKNLRKYFPSAESHVMRRTDHAAYLVNRAGVRAAELAGKPGAAGSRNIVRLAQQNFHRIAQQERVKMGVLTELTWKWAEQTPLYQRTKDSLSEAFKHLSENPARYRASQLFVQSAPPEIRA